MAITKAYRLLLEWVITNVNFEIIYLKKVKKIQQPIKIILICKNVKYNVKCC